MTPLDCITLLVVISAASPLASMTQSLPFLFLDYQRLTLHRIQLRLAAACHDALTQVLGGEAACTT
jgi:hypothetical protein